MTRDDPTPLLAEFPIPTYDSWVIAAERELRGRSLADLSWQTDDGIACPPLFTSRDIADLPHLASDVLEAVMPGTPWAIRQRIDAADPALAATLCADAIAGGADELLLRFDRLAMRGADPGTLADSELEVDLFDTDAGLDGCAIYYADALDEVLGGVDLAHTRIAFEPGSSALAVLGMVLQVADRRGVARDSLRLELGLDPLRELVTGPTLATSTEHLVAEAGATVRAVAALPGVVPLAVHSSPYHHAGAAPAFELACTIATAAAYLRQLNPTDTDSIVLRIAVDTDIYIEVAKLRAARLLFAKVAHAFGRFDTRITVHAESSARSWSTDDVHTNLLRSNVQAFAATLAGCDSISLAPFDALHDRRDLDAQRLARNQLILLREESMMQRVVDPCRGSFAIEALTDQLARLAWEHVQEIESRGGMVVSLDDGFVQNKIAATAECRRQGFATGSRTLVGTSRFVDPKYHKSEFAAPDEELIQHQMFEHLAKREPSDMLIAADDLDSLTAAAAAGCTVGEITRAIRGSHPLELEQTFFELSADSAPFEVLRDLVRGADVVVQPIVVGDARIAQARHEFARDFFTTSGFEMLDAVASIGAIASHARIVVLCGDDASVDSLTPAVGRERKVIVTAPPRAELADHVDAFIHHGCDALRIARELFLQVTADPEEEA